MYALYSTCDPVKFGLISKPDQVSLKLVITKTHLFKYIENFTPIKGKFQIKNSDILYIPWRGGSNEYPQSMYLIRDKKNNVYPCKP